MIGKKRVKRYLKERQAGLLHCLSVLAVSANSEAIHDLRLHTKKLKAMERLCGLHKKGFLSPLKPMIDEAGRVRTAELHRQTLNKFNYYNEPLTQELSATANEGYAAMKRNYEPYVHTTLVAMKRWNKELRDLPEKRVLLFFRSLLKKLSSPFRMHVREEELHEARKRIKHLLYAVNFLPKKYKKAIGNRQAIS